MAQLCSTRRMHRCDIVDFVDRSVEGPRGRATRWTCQSTVDEEERNHRSPGRHLPSIGNSLRRTASAPVSRQHHADHLEDTR
jgi:hypothetical protein